MVSLPAFDTEAHRGGRGLYPENTIPAMLHALSLGVTTLEMDAVITSDAQVILSHEPFFNHAITTKPDGSFIEEKEEKQFNIYKMSYAETQQYDVGMKPNPRFPRQQKMKASKPLLSAVIDSAEAFALANHRVLPFYNIETKLQPLTDNVYHPAPAAFVGLLLKIINDKKITERVIIQSFDPRSLQVLHQQQPGIKTSLLIEGYDKRSLDEQLQQLGFVPTIYSPAYELVNPALVKACKDKKIKLVPWTVNDAAAIQRLKAMGVDGIISDYPDLF
ncbi:MAG TPA: glycerophosphodiester phosphodiesterase family protein [Chitinophagaceae bacterium]|nr:glycerophosphodiester phosphodiesterase family protein [Chitinophagaceae bacterium]